MSLFNLIRPSKPAPAPVPVPATATATATHTRPLAPPLPAFRPMSLIPVQQQQQHPCAYVAQTSSQDFAHVKLVPCEKSFFPEVKEVGPGTKCEEMKKDDQSPKIIRYSGDDDSEMNSILGHFSCCGGD